MTDPQIPTTRRSSDALMRHARRFGIASGLALVAVAAVAGGPRAAAAAAATWLLGWAGVEAMATGLGVVLLGNDPGRAGRASLAGFVFRHVTLAVALFLLVLVAHLPGLWLAAGATAWPPALALAALAAGSHRPLAAVPQAEA